MSKSSSETYFYQSGEVNQTGKADGRYITDRLAQQLLIDRTPLLSGVTASRRKCYRVDSHHKGRSLPHSNRREEIAAISLYLAHDMILDYQIPLRERKGEYGEGETPARRGKIDLLMAWDDALYLTELKWENSPETLLRAALEIETYAHMLDETILLDNWSPPRWKAVRKAVLLPACESCNPYREWMDPEGFPFVHKLLREWGIHVFLVDSAGAGPRPADKWS